MLIKKDEPYIYNVTMQSRGELFTPPPAGRLGVIPLFPTLPKPEVGQVIEFHFQGELLVRGIITAVEPPKSNLRSDIPKKERDKWKIHWVPYELHDAFFINKEPNGPTKKNSCRGRHKQSVLLRKATVRKRPKA